jgi:hypothetical protein
VDADSNRARLGGDLTPGERLARRRLPPATDEERRRVAAEPYRRRQREAGSLPASGRPHDSVTLERNQDYGSDSDLCFGIGNSVTRVRVTGLDLHRLRSLLLDQGYDLGELYERAGHLQAEAAPLSQFRDLVATAHATGYRLAVEDQRETAQDAGYVRDFLAGLGRQTEAGSLYEADQQAVERVIALLEAM